MGGWRNNFYGLCIIRMIKSRRMRWAGHVAKIGENMNASRILVESQKERDH
jgi:hypothetical protein